jgi:aminoglycoside phosphotransferase (APT) family kinase protein
VTSSEPVDLARSHENDHPAVNAEASLVHGDFNSPNIFVRHERGSWRVAAILDWEFAFAGSILCDIGNMLRYERPTQSRYEPHFSRGLLDEGWRAPDDWFLRVSPTCPRSASCCRATTCPRPSSVSCAT